MTTIVVRHEERDRFDIEIRGHVVTVDQPLPGSTDEGPTPTELFVASLTACAAFYARRFLSRHGFGDGDLRLTADFAFSADHSRVASIAITLRTPRPIPEDLQPALRRVVEHCTVHESIRTPPAVDVELALAEAEALA